MHVEDVEGTGAADLVQPGNLIQPPRHIVDAGMGVLVVSRGACRPEVVPAASDGAETYRARIPGLQRGSFRLKEVRQLGVSGVVGVNVSVRSIPDFGLVVHVVEVATGDRRIRHIAGAAAKG